MDIDFLQALFFMAISAGSMGAILILKAVGMGVYKRSKRKKEEEEDGERKEEGLPRLYRGKCPLSSAVIQDIYETKRIAIALKENDILAERCFEEQKDRDEKLLEKFDKLIELQTETNAILINRRRK